MDQEVNLEEKFSLLDKPYSPAIVGYVNDYKLQIVKVEGSSSGHKHDETDDFFLVIRGHPERRFRNSTVYRHYRTRADISRRECRGTGWLHRVTDLAEIAPSNEG